jgi:hypothetical protein
MDHEPHEETEEEEEEEVSAGQDAGGWRADSTPALGSFLAGGRSCFKRQA